MEAILIIVGIALLGAMTPGPDFILITRLSLQRSRAAGVAGALGIGTGLCIHLSYMALGLAIIIVHLPWLMNIIRILGALYLSYLGIQAWRENPHDQGADVKRRAKQGFMQGLLTNLLNPKAMLFLLALMSSAELHHGAVVIVISAILIVITTTLWFVLLSCWVTLPWFTRGFNVIQPYLGKVLGSFLLIFAIFILVFETGLWSILFH